MASIVSRLDLEKERELLKFFPECVRLHLLYKASHHGVDMSTLVSKFDKQGKFILAVYLESGLVRGGFTSKAVTSNNCTISAEGAFVYELNHHDATKFPILDHSKALTCTYDSLSFGNCLRVYVKDRIMYADLDVDIIYSSTGWCEDGLRCVDVELHRVQDAGDVLLNPWREVEWTESGRGDLRESFVSFKLACKALTRVRVLMLGPAGAGKSSFINSIRSVMYGRVIHMPFTGTATKNYIKKFKCYDIQTEKGGSPTALTLCDVMALRDRDSTGLTLYDALAVIKGHVPDGHTFDDTLFGDWSGGYRPMPAMKDKIHCAVFVLDASKVTTYCKGLQQTLRMLQAEISDLDIPQVILLTHVDQVCHAVHEDVKYVYTSRILQEKMHKAAELVGLPVSYVLPVKNYSTELSVNCNMDILLLSAVQNILQAVDDNEDNSSSPTGPTTCEVQ